MIELCSQPRGWQIRPVRPMFDAPEDLDYWSRFRWL